jgi:hypothetical protein
MINLGDLVQDKVTGYKGVVLAKMKAMFEASKCRVHPRKLDDKGDIKKECWIEADRLELIEEFALIGFKQLADIGIEEKDHQ